MSRCGASAETLMPADGEIPKVETAAESTKHNRQNHSGEASFDTTLAPQERNFIGKSSSNLELQKGKDGRLRVWVPQSESHMGIGGDISRWRELGIHCSLLEIGQCS